MINFHYKPNYIKFMNKIKYLKFLFTLKIEIKFKNTVKMVKDAKAFCVSESGVIKLF